MAQRGYLEAAAANDGSTSQFFSYGLKEDSPFVHKYLGAFYWVNNVLITHAMVVNYPQTYLEACFVIGVMLLHLTFLSYIICLVIPLRWDSN